MDSPSVKFNENPTNMEDVRTSRSRNPNDMGVTTMSDASKAIRNTE